MPWTSSDHRDSKGPEISVTCADCSVKFPCSLNIEWKTDVSLQYEISLFAGIHENSAFCSQSFTCTGQDDVTQKCKVKCQNCSKYFWLSVDHRRIIGKTQRELKITLTFNTSKAENQKNEDTENIPKQPKTDQNQFHVGKSVKVFFMSTGVAFGADNELKKNLMMDQPSSTHVKKTTLEDSDIIFVFCPITSRAGSDVESAMNDGTVSSSGKKVILVLMHHTRDDDYSFGGTNWSEEYEKIVLYVHVLFHETVKGLLKCRQNNDVVSIIKNELHKHAK